MTRLSAFRTSVHHHLIINNKLSNHNLYASNFNYVKFSPSLSLVKKKKKKDQNSSPNGDRTRRYYKAKMRNNFATREQSVKPCESSFADKFPSLICIRAICKPVCYIRAREGGEIKRKRGERGREGGSARQASFFASCYRVSYLALNLVAEAGSRLSPSTVIKRGGGY